MKTELLIIGVTIFFILNIYSDGKFVKIVKSWKKYYQMAGIGFIGLSAYIFMKKYPSHSKNLMCHANGLIKYMPIDKEASDLLMPLLNMSGGAMMSAQERRILTSGGGGSNPNMMGPNMMGTNMMGTNMMGPGRGTGTSGSKNVKRSVSETKKKYVAAQQGWNCGGCKRQLPAWFEVDHKIRLDNGGSNSVDNLVALCRDCHGKKTAFENL